MRRLLALAAILTLVWSFGCGDKSAESQTAQSTEPASSPTKKPVETKYPPAPPGVIRINLGPDPPYIDPNLVTDVSGSWVVNHLFEPLIRMDEDANVHPAQAESWEHDDAYKVWTFHLRKNNKWHNGDPVTAHDFVYGIRRCMKKSTKAQYATMVYTFIEGGQKYYDSDGADDAGLGVEAVDDYTLRLTLQNSTPYFPSVLYLCTWFPLHKATVENHGLDWVLPENYMGDGPFRMKEYRHKDVMILEKSDTYWDKDNVHFNTIEFKMIVDLATEVSAFVSGDLDLTGQISILEAPNWIDRPEFKRSKGIAILYVGFNVSKPPFDDPALRKAFALTINRDTIVNKVTRRGELPGTGLIPAGLKTHDGRDYRDILPSYYKVDIPPNATKEEIAKANKGAQEANVAKAKSILAEAGYAVDGKPGKPIPRVTYLYNTDDTNKAIAEILQSMWKQSLGADVQLQNMEWTVLLSNLRAKNYEFSRNSWFGDYLDPMTFLEIFEGDSGHNRVGYKSEKYDALLKGIREETDPVKRDKLIAEAERLVIEEDCVIAPVYFYVIPVLLRPEIHGVVHSPLGGLDVVRAWRDGEK